MNFGNDGISRTLWACCLLAFAACSSSPTTLHIDLITTLSPGDEFDTIHLEVSERFTDQRVDLEADYANGARIATVEIEGNVRVRVVLFNDGNAVAMEDLFVTARTGIQVVRIEIVDGRLADAGTDVGVDIGEPGPDAGPDAGVVCPPPECDENNYIACGGTGTVSTSCGSGSCRPGTLESGGGCFDRLPSNVGDVYVPAGGPTQTFDGQTWDTDDCEALPGFHSVESDTTPALCILSFGSVDFENDHIVTGSRALVVVAAQDISIGSFAADGTGRTPGPGGNWGVELGDISDSVDGEIAENGGGGGGGGAAPAAQGGRGGGPEEGGGAAGGFATGGAEPGVPLTSGGGGGTGVLAESITAVAVGGGGGGALQFSARGHLTITGAINISGGGGQSATVGRFDVGGGGGGLLLLEAGVISFENASILGGGGGGGCMGQPGYEEGRGGPSCEGSWGGGADRAEGSNAIENNGGGGGFMVLRAPVIMIEGLELGCHRVDRTDTDLTRVSP